VQNLVDHGTADEQRCGKKRNERGNDDRDAHGFRGPLAALGARYPPYQPPHCCAIRCGGPQTGIHARQFARSHAHIKTAELFGRSPSSSILLEIARYGIMLL